MSTDDINKAFEDMIQQRGIHEKLGITSGNVRNYRYKLKVGDPIKLDTKIELLKRSGWQEPVVEFTRQDLVDFIGFYEKQSAAAKAHGAEYLVEKWERSKK